MYLVAAITNTIHFLFVTIGIANKRVRWLKQSSQIPNFVLNLRSAMPHIVTWQYKFYRGKSMRKNMKKTNLRFIASAFALGLAAVLLVIPSANVSRAASNNIFAPQPVPPHDLTDANITAIVTVADNLDIDYGKIALSRTKNKMVREFAQLMIIDHTAVQKAVGDLAGNLWKSN